MELFFLNVFVCRIDNVEAFPLSYQRYDNDEYRHLLTVKIFKICVENSISRGDDKKIKLCRGIFSL